VADAIESLKLCPLLATPGIFPQSGSPAGQYHRRHRSHLPKVNEIMTAVTEQFGRDSHVIMGAVIDESMQGRVEVCVLGTSDIGAAHAQPRRPLPCASAKADPCAFGADS
jgi:cell division protein FtsZ